MRVLLSRLCFVLSALMLSASAFALTPAQTLALAAGDNDERIAALDKAVASGDASLAAFAQALLADEVKFAGERVFILRDGKAVDASTGVATTLPDNAEDVVNSNRMRRALEGALAALKLFSTDVGARSQAIDELLREQPDEARLPAVEKAYASETEAWLKERLSRLRAAILVSSPDKNKRLEAAQALAESRQPATRTLLLERLAKSWRCLHRTRRRGSRRAAPGARRGARPAWPGASGSARCSPA